MTTLTIEDREAQRLFASILRDDLKLPPERANEVAETLCRRILTSMPARVKSWSVREWRAIDEWPEKGPDFVAELRQVAPMVDVESAGRIWHIVYRFCRDLPVDVMAKLSARDGR